MTTRTPAMTSNRPYLLRAVHEWICDNGLTPYIVVDATQPGLQVPPQAVSEDRVVLNLAPQAVAGLEIGNQAISCMARFSGVGYTVSVPVAAVRAIYAHENGQGMLLAVDDANAALPADAAPPLQVVPERAPDTTGSTDAGTATATPSRDHGPEEPQAKGKPTLHVVK